MGDLGDMFFPVQHRLIQVRDAPALRDVEAEQGCQFRSRRAGDGVLPSAERRQKVPVFVEGQIAVHHGGDAHSTNVFPAFHPGQRGFQALPHLVE